MIKHIISLSALLLSIAFMLFAGGINSLLLPMRGNHEGFATLLLGLMGSGWAAGYISGCIFTPSLVTRSGHIRVFCVLTALAATAILASLLFINPIHWIALRALSGFCFAGATMVVESWINSEADQSNRGKLFGAYTFVSLSATTLGQMTLSLGDYSSHHYFVIAAIMYSMAVIPVGLTATTTPAPVFKVKFNFKALRRRAPISAFSVLMIGIANGAFGTLGVVYAKTIGIPTSISALFCSLPILCGAVMQLPVGILSDRWDRRKTLFSIALYATAVEIIFMILLPTTVQANLLFSITLGGALYTFYPVIVALANDHTDSGMHLQTSGEVLVMFSVGTIIGPLLGGLVMELAGGHKLFMVTGLAHLAIVLHTFYHILVDRAKDKSDKTEFIPTPLARTVTPETFVLVQGDEEQPEDNKVH